MAGRYSKRFAKKGFEPSQEHLLAGVRAAGFDGATVLEVGCGVGYVHRQLLTDGAARATGVDLSEGMVREALRLSAEAGFTEHTAYHVADYVDVAGEIGPADITILDKVICCYPHPGPLLEAATHHTRRVLTYTIPRWRWLTRGMVACVAVFGGLFRFRPWVHDPRALHAAVTGAGFEHTGSAQTFLWLTEVYHRGEPTVSSP